MPVAIIGGTGIYSIPGIETEKKIISTDFGDSCLHFGKNDFSEFIFLARHGIEHSIPPHKINYRANIKALQLCGVKRVIATFAVGSISNDYPLETLIILRDFLDYTSGREATFYDEIKQGIGHVEMSHPYSPYLSDAIKELALNQDIDCCDNAVYVGVNGPRFETPAEINAYRLLGGHVVGMTGLPEVTLAAEAGMNYAAIALAINWASGMKNNISIVDGDIETIRKQMLHLMIEVLKNTSDEACEAITIL